MAGNFAFNALTVIADHKDLIHHCEYDIHGRRIATCSSDQSVKVWDRQSNGHWVRTASWKTHNGSVWRVRWAHPEFGQVLATCSFDRTVSIWEEIVSDGSAGRGQTHWVHKNRLVDSRTNITDIAFAPKHLGLILGVCSQDGMVRIYEAPDIMNLSQWTILCETCLPNKMRCSCLSWNSSRLHPPLLSVGSDDSAAGSSKVCLLDFNEECRKILKTTWAAAVSEAVYDLAFAPNVGRSFHLLAVASKTVEILSVKITLLDGGDSNLEITVLANFDQHNGQVWRISWNLTGTILASSGIDGTIRLWKANYLENWKCISVLKAQDDEIVQKSVDENLHDRERFY